MEFYPNRRAVPVPTAFMARIFEVLGPTMETILLVEDTSFFEKAVTRLFKKSDGFNIIVAKTYSEASKTIKDQADELFVALVDLTLPDTVDIESVDLTIAAGVPTIVFSSRYDEALRAKILAKGVVDYVLKDSPASLGYLKELVFRLRSNRNVGALVVDDSTTQLRLIAERLRRLQLNVYTATSGREALEILNQTPSIRLAVLDYLMPDMDGIQLLKEIRGTRGPEHLAIMGLSSSQDPDSMARFLKFGANDFLSKSCSQEEFMLRVGQNLDTIERIIALTEAANRDQMTGLPNRRYLFDTGKKTFDKCQKSGRTATVALIDIDYFKKINDRFGHEAGDMVIRQLADDLRDAGSEATIATRLGGDEFCLLLPDYDQAAAIAHCHKVYETFASRKLRYRSKELPITVSIGVSSGTETSFDEALRVADTHMYDAKKQGRNRIASADCNTLLCVELALQQV